MTGPSDKALACAEKAAEAAWSAARIADSRGEDAVQAALDAVHDPALGLDRSVCLRDVVASLRGRFGFDDPMSSDAADFIEREFAGGGS